MNTNTKITVASVLSAIAGGIAIDNGVYATGLVLVVLGVVGCITVAARTGALE